MPAAAAIVFRSRAKAWRVRWPLSLSAGNSQRPAAAPGAYLVEEVAIGFHRRARRAGNRHEAFLVALAAHRDQRLLGARRGFRQRDEFGDAQARGVDELDQARHAAPRRDVRAADAPAPPAPRAQWRSADRPRRRSAPWAAGGRGAGPRSPGSDRRRAVPRHRDVCGTGAPRKAGARAKPRASPSAPRAAMKARTSALDAASALAPRSARKSV